MGLLETLADALTRKAGPKAEYGTPSPELAQQMRSGGLTGGLLRTANPMLWDDNSGFAEWTRKPAGSPMGNAALEEILNGPVMATFAGVNAKTADLAKLATAKELSAKGADNEAVRQATGWFKGMDSKWRFEIDDSASKIGKAAADEFIDRDVMGGKAAGILWHNDLYRAYPELRGIDVAVSRDPSVGGSFGGSSISAKSPSAKDARSTLLHELQHAIQQREGFAKGGSPSMFPDMAEQKQLLGDGNVLTRIYEFTGGDMNAAKERFRQYFKREPALGAESLALSGTSADEMLSQSMAIKSPEQMYRSLAGEIEARDVSARMNLTPAQRLATPPDLRPDAIVRYGNGVKSFLPYD